MRGRRVEGIAKVYIRQTHVGDTFKTCYKYVGYAWCESAARCCTSLKIVACFVRVWDQKLFKDALTFSRSSVCPERVTYTFRISSTRVTGALNTLRTRLAQVLGMSVYATCAF